MAQVVLKFSAQCDLIDIDEYIARDNPLRALSFIGELKLACQSL